MLEFKEIPCTVYELTVTNKVRKVTVHSYANQWSKALGMSSRGHVCAKDCYKSFDAAVEAGKKGLAKRIKRLTKIMEECNQAMMSLDQQMNLHLNPRKKAIHVPAKQR